MGAPTVFLSSTSLDLKPYRDAALAAARGEGFAAICMEDFAANGRRYTLEECLHQVDQADVVIALVAHRYGSTPPKQTKSFTWLECKHARENKNKKIEVIALVVEEDDDKWQWPMNLREEYRLLTEPHTRVKKAVNQLKAFKKWLGKYPTRGFKTPDDVKLEVIKALAKWSKENSHAPRPPPGNPSEYLSKLREATRWIKIEGIQVAGHPTQQFEIRQIYIPLTTNWSADVRKGVVEHQREVTLEKALAERRLMIVGDPGAGKTTFLRRVAFEMCQADRQSKSFLSFDDGSLPILISIYELAGYIKGDNTAGPNAIADFLEHQAEKHNWILTGEFFRQKLKNGPCRLLFDGLDEAPDRTARENMVRLIEQAAVAYPKCHFVVTTRPVTESVLSGFRTVHLADLGSEAIHTFLDEWSGALYQTEPDKAVNFRDKLKQAISSRDEIRKLAKNPVMLTVLAVLQANNRELPEHRVELYEEILTWLAKARERKPGRVKAERCLELLWILAFAMQADSGGKKRQAGKGWAADQLKSEFSSRREAEQFLDKEQTDSGIVVSRGAEVQFWHLTFLEYLAARRIAALPDVVLHSIVISGGNLYKPEWREVMRLLGGVLMSRQGRERVEELLKAILDQLGKKPRLAAQAKCAALLGAMMRDLERMGYQPKDPRYQQTMNAMQSLFDPTQSAGIDINTRIEAAEAVGQAGDPRMEQENWIPIPAGKFWMGAQKEKGRNQDEEAYDDEAPVHEVTLNKFLIGRYPVTVQEYQKFIDEGGYEKEEYWRETGGFGKFTEPEKWEEQQSHGNRPVTGVSWYEAAAYCKRARGRLPREAEWERAARGARENAKYPWGNEPIDETRANYRGHVGRPTPVGLYPLGATTEGVDDMMGNVVEWCLDWFGPYPNGPDDNPSGPRSGKGKVLRGGSWDYVQGVVRVSFRVRSQPVDRGDYVGFRCVRESLNP